MAPNCTISILHCNTIMIKWSRWIFFVHIYIYIYSSQTTVNISQCTAFLESLWTIQYLIYLIILQSLCNSYCAVHYKSIQYGKWTLLMLQMELSSFGSPYQAWLLKSPGNQQVWYWLCRTHTTYHRFAMREVLPLYVKPISCQSKASVVCSVTAAMFIDFCLKKLNVFSQHIGKKTNAYLNPRRTNPQELKCWSTFCVNY